MIICNCSGISDAEIREAIRENRIEDLYFEGMMQHCGSCREDIREIYEEYEENDPTYRCNDKDI